MKGRTSAIQLTLLFVVLFAVNVLVRAEPHFEVIDNDENSVFGTIATLDRTQVVVDAQGTTHTIPLENLVKIRNITPNPYGSVPTSTDGSQKMLQQMPSAPMSTARGANERRIADVLVKEAQANELTTKKTFPNNVIALELDDGSRLTASTFTAAKSQGVFRLLDQQNDLSLPLSSITAVRFSVRSLSEVVNPPTNWQRLAVPNAEGDRLIVGNPDSFDVYAGILNNISAETVAFAVDGEVLPIPRRKAFGLVLHQEVSLASEPPLGSVTLWTGTKGMISDIRLNENELTWTTSSGLTVTVPLEMVDEMDFGEKRIASLLDFELVRSNFSFPFASDIQSAQLPLLQTFYESRTKTPSGETTLDGIVYGRSITLRGKASLEYLLPKPFVSLKAVVGVEDQFRPHTSATLQIMADSQILGTWELRGDSAAQRIHVNLPKNCRMVTIIAEPPPQSDIPAVLTIAEPKLLE